MIVSLVFFVYIFYFYTSVLPQNIDVPRMEAGHE